MPERPDDTCDPSITSWITSANTAGIDFPLQNLPLGIVRRHGSAGPWRAGIAIGDKVLDLAGCADANLLASLAPALRHAVCQPKLNALMALGAEAVGTLRQTVHALLRDDVAPSRREDVARCLVDVDDVECGLPVAVGSFTDFFSSLHHVTNVVRVRNPEASLPANYAHAPLAYQARASSLLVSGTPVARPYGPRRASSGAVYAPTERLDYEVELGLFVGAGTTLGLPVSIETAHTHLVGACLLNDWSARDVQSFEAQPLGPFLSKSFATSISPWIVTMQALQPFRVPAAPRPAEFSPALPHLVDATDQARGALAITLEAWLSSQTMREMDMAPWKLSSADARSLFWTPAQLVTHHTSNGCSLQTGDLLGTGTISGHESGTSGSLLELTRGAREPLTLPTGETRGFLHDGDEVTIRAWCEAPGAARIGFGECRGRVAPAHPLRQR